MKTSIFLILYLFISQCNYIEAKRETSQLSCESVLDSIIRNSKIESRSKDSKEFYSLWNGYKWRVNKKSKDEVLIKLYFIIPEEETKNSENPSDERTAGWLRLDLKNNLLLDITYDDLYPDTLFLDKDHLQIFKSNCSETD